jgi:hypothetical protein
LPGLISSLAACSSRAEMVCASASDDFINDSRVSAIDRDCSGSYCTSAGGCGVGWCCSDVNNEYTKC